MSDQMRSPMDVEPPLDALTQRCAERWMALFANRTRPYAVQQGDGSYRWVYEELTPQLVVAHLMGELTLALSSTDVRGEARWACLDVDVPGSFSQLLALRDALAELGLPGLVEASRRGGHLWLLLDEVAPAVALRFVVAEALAQIAAQGVEIPAHELYPDAPATAALARRLGHAVRLPLGVHRKTGRRYPLFDAQGLPCAFTMVERAVAFILDVPRVVSGPLREQWQISLAQRAAERKAARAAREAGTERTGRTSGQKQRVEQVEGHSGTQGGIRVGTRSAAIRWVDARVSALDLLAELAPESEMRRAGRGYIGWCPFHDDRSPDAQSGERGTPSFYVVQDRRYGWSWRCLSTNCVQSDGLMRHSFRLLQELLGISVAAAIREAASRWPAAAGPANASAEDPEDPDERKEIADGDQGN
jgi:hypothetical protein